MRAKGFTLTEMVITIVVVSIMFLGIAGFVKFGTQGYVQTIDRQRLQNQARFAIEKLSREISYAVPNGFELTSNGNCLSFYTIKYAGLYVKRENTGRVEFVVDEEEISTFPANMRLVINPSRVEDLENGGQSVSVAGISSETGSDYFSVAMTPASDSVGNRHFIFDSSSKIEYCITSDERLIRSEGGGTEITVGTGIDFEQSEFYYQETALQRGGLVHLNFLFFNGDEQSSYKHDVQVSNVP